MDECDKINMHDEYVLFGSGEPVRVLCIDAPGCTPVISLAPDGKLREHDPYGIFDSGESTDDYEYDLIRVVQTVIVACGTYVTRSGVKLQVICIDCPGPKPIVCITSSGAYAGHWHANGRRDDTPAGYDIVERIS